MSLLAWYIGAAAVCALLSRKLIGTRAYKMTVRPSFDPKVVCGPVHPLLPSLAVQPTTLHDGRVLLPLWNATQRMTPLQFAKSVLIFTVLGPLRLVVISFGLGSAALVAWVAMICELAWLPLSAPLLPRHLPRTSLLL
jgi:hypothetical protein